MNSLMRSILVDPKPVLAQTDPIRVKGKVIDINGMIIESIGPPSRLGDVCHIRSDQGNEYLAEVVGVHGDHNQLMTFSDVRGLSVGCEVLSDRQDYIFPMSDNFLGRVINGLGMPIDDKGVVQADDFVSLRTTPLNPLKRIPITKSIDTGIKAIDGMLTIGEGQRIGIFAGTGVGKSTLLGQIARNSSADINVIALIGERGREVRDFIEKNLKKKGLHRSVVIVATSDEPPLMRIKGAYLATAIAEYFRGKGKRVLLLMDSITRFARAVREIGLALGEPPTTKGYPPRIFTMLPQLLERVGLTKQGSITGIYNVLMEGDDIYNPVEDEVRSILDGHIVLDRQLANRGQYPAIDILSSISRVMPEVVTEEQLKLANHIRSVYAIYRDIEDLVTLGAYVKGADPKTDFAIDNIDNIQAFLTQNRDDVVPRDTLLSLMKGVL